MTSVLIKLSDEYYQKLMQLHFKTKEKRMKLTRQLLEEAIDRKLSENI